MGSILSFAPRQAAIGRSSRATVGSASVIIFPGVRYERQPDEDKDGGVASKNGQPRAVPSPRR
jgi:hypothetical protein